MASQFFYPSPTWKDRDITGYTVIVPTVSIGNVPQLVVDILLANLTAPSLNDHTIPSHYEYVGTYIDNYALEPYSAIEPFVPSAVYNKNRICNAIELYTIPNTQILIIQQRSNPISHRSKAFYKQFSIFLTQILSPKLLLLLTSITNQHREDDELSNKQNLQYFVVEPLTKDIPTDFTDVISTHSDYITAITPPQNALNTPLSQLCNKILTLSHTKYQNFHNDHFHSIKHDTSHASFIYEDGSLLEKDNDKKRVKKNKEKIFLPFALKGNNHFVYALAKYSRKYNIPFLGLVSLNHKGDTRPIALSVYKKLSFFLQFIICKPSFSPNEITDASVEDYIKDQNQTKDENNKIFLDILQRSHPLSPIIWNDVFEEY